MAHAVHERLPVGAAWLLAAALSGACTSTPEPPAAAPAATLENTYWKLMTLRGQPAEVPAQQREPHLILQAAQQRVAGSGGCNRLAGSYVRDADRLRFGPSAATRMACSQGMAQEGAFLVALSEVTRWRVSGERLELLDEGGTVLARFESRYMP